MRLQGKTALVTGSTSGMVTATVNGRLELIKLKIDYARLAPQSADGKTFTLFLRKGMKWSDGAPFTADDFVKF